MLHKIEELKKLELNDNSILVVKGLFTANDLNELRNMICKYLKLKNVIIINANNDQDIGTISEEEMNKAGWCRKK